MPQIFHLLLANAFSLLYLVVHYEFGILVEYWVLAPRERCTIRELLFGVKVWGSYVHETVSLLNHLLNIYCIAVMKEILQYNRPADEEA